VEHRNGDPPPFGDEEARASLEQAKVAILPVPFEGTVSYGAGASRGPAAILHASTQLELYDEQSALAPHRYGIWTDRLLDVTDAPDAESVANAVANRVGQLMDADKWVVTLGGEHSITPGAVRSAAARKEGLRVIQLDAHADLRDSYEGDAWSHACAMRRCLEIAPVHAIGVRSYSEGEADRIRSGVPGYRVAHAWEMGDERRIEQALEGVGPETPVYLTIDLDYFDPAIMPSTGTPEPGGGQWWPTLRLLTDLFHRAPVVACDVVELAPIPGLHHPEFTAARLVYKLIGLAAGAGSLD
jgi:agmatinase